MLDKENKSKKKVKVVDIYADTPEEAIEKINKFIADNGIKLSGGGADLKKIEKEILSVRSSMVEYVDNPLPRPSPRGDKSCPCGCDRDPKNIVKTIPATKEEVAENKEIITRAIMLKELEKILLADKARWWAKVKLRIPDGYDSSYSAIHYNEETKEIEYLRYEDKDDVNS